MMNKQTNKSLSFKIKESLVNYLKTQFILFLIVILIVWGIMSLIPNLNFFIELFIVLAAFLLISNLMDLFVAPYFVGKKTKVSPLLIFTSFLIGISFFGIIGALLAIPLALIIKTTWEHYSN